MNTKKKNFINKNAGNVEIGQAAFNSSVGSCTMMEDADIKERYRYYGPVFRFDRYYGDIEKREALYTEATSKKQAINNLTCKAKDMFNIPRNWNLTIDEDSVRQITNNAEYLLDKEIESNKKHYCDYCKTQLTDAGECPICDLGEDPDEFN